jgi:hypothetical protein
MQPLLRMQPVLRNTGRLIPSGHRRASELEKIATRGTAAIPSGGASLLEREQGTTVDRSGTQFLFDPKQLIVFCHAIASRGRSGLDLSR